MVKSRYTGKQLDEIIHWVTNEPDGEIHVARTFGVAGPDLTKILQELGIRRCQWCKHFVVQGDKCRFCRPPSFEDAKKVLVALRTGSCWCDVGAGKPMEHTEACKLAQRICGQEGK